MKLAKINDIKADNSQILEFDIYKDFPFSGFLYSIIAGIFAFLWICAVTWIIGSPGHEAFTIKSSIVVGILMGIAIYLPSYISALIMNKLRKPILRFDIDGFYYTPQIWSRSKLYKWKDISNIEMGRNGEDELLIKVYLSNGKCVSINETILPIHHKELLKVFQYRLKNIPIKDLQWPNWGA